MLFHQHLGYNTSSGFKDRSFVSGDIFVFFWGGGGGGGGGYPV